LLLEIDVEHGGTCTRRGGRRTTPAG
jgi:hypothetical protein